MSICSCYTTFPKSVGVIDTLLIKVTSFSSYFSSSFFSRPQRITGVKLECRSIYFSNCYCCSHIRSINLELK